ncbi:MAG: hypothetical protein MPJ50_01955 [Pirellulales bacterium]|nr:hypothetical protein [Pirellulales bacterium]
MKREALIILLLSVICGGVQCYMIWRAVTPAQDAVRFVAIAQRMEQDGIVSTLRDETEHPLYPLAIRATYPVITSVCGERVDNWALAAQVAAALPLVLCLIPTYLLLRTVLDSGGGAFGTVLFALSPEFIAFGGGALADGWMILFTSTFLCCIARILLLTKSNSARNSTLRCAGLATISGLALGLGAVAHQLTLVAGAAALCVASVLIICVAPTVHAALRRLVICGITSGLGLCGVLAGWLLAADAVTPTAAVATLLGRETAETAAVAELLSHSDMTDDATRGGSSEGGARLRRRRKSRFTLASGEPMVFDKKDPNLSLRRQGWLAITAKFLGEMQQAHGLALGLLAITGAALWLRNRSVPGDGHSRKERYLLPVLFGGFFLMYSLTVLIAASRFGYVSARHLLPAVLVAVPLAVEAIQRVMAQLRRWTSLTAEGSASRHLATASMTAVGCCLLLMPLFSPLHASRSPHRQAACWMAETGRPPGNVLDTRGWTQFYSGRKTHLLSAGRKALKDPKLRYIVLERRELGFDTRRAATLREIVGIAANPVATFPSPDGNAEKAVLIFQWNVREFATRASQLAKR